MSCLRWVETSSGRLVQHVIVQLAFSDALQQPSQMVPWNWVIRDNDGISDGYFLEIQTHNIFISKGAVYGLLTSSIFRMGSRFFFLSFFLPCVLKWRAKSCAVYTAVWEWAALQVFPRNVVMQVDKMKPEKGTLTMHPVILNILKDINCLSCSLTPASCLKLFYLIWQEMWH